MKKRKLKKNVKIGFFILIIILIFGIAKISKKIKTKKYHSTVEYKLLKVGYNNKEIKLLKDKTNNKFMLSLLDIDYDKNYIAIIKDKYYIKNKLNKYITYYEENLNTKPNDVVTLVNVHADKPWYEQLNETDTNKDNLMINNKFYKLPDNYEPKDLVEISNWYSYGTKPMLRSEAYDSFQNMFNAAKEENITIIINSAYRSYDYQKDLYDKYIKAYGKEYTDNYAARPGHSEHQTGLAIDVTTYGAKADTFEQTKAYEWLQEHAYEYGFILRYPKDKENITGYKYESWHYRYVGVNVATQIHNENITFDEYYAYYIDNK